MILPGPPIRAAEACPEQSRRARFGVVRKPHSMRPSPASQRHRDSSQGGRARSEV